jgi:glycosyltransferase involved in cell wall biosynthesis
LTTLISPALHGPFDGLVASRAGALFPDLIGFFQDASALIKPDGLIALVLPDKRARGGFFQPVTMTVDVVEAHLKGRSSGQRRMAFNQAAYSTAGGTAPFRLANSVFDAQRAYDTVTAGPSLPDRDDGAWLFTPKSFELLILELNLLGHIDWSIRSIGPAEGGEFHVWLQRRPLALPEAEINPARLSLLTAMVHEGQDAIARISASRNITISVVIPLYNGAHHIEEALNSVFRQTMPAAEIIVVNDGSTDNGAGVAIVERLAKTHPVILVHQVNGGQSSARNRGVRESRGELIAFLDQDDVWYDNHLQELVKPFQSPSARPVGWVYSNLDEIDESGSLVCRDFLNTLPTVHPKRQIQDCIRQDMFVLPSAALISRKAFEEVGGFDEQLCGYEDDDLFLRMFRAGYDNIYLDMPLSKWRIYAGSTSYSPRMARSRAIYTRKLLRMFPDDAKRDVCYARDLIIPRFAENAVREYREAVRLGDRAAIETAWAESRFLAKQDKCLIGRLYDQTLLHYKAALIEGDDTAIAAAWTQMAEAAAASPKANPRIRATVSLLRNPRVSRSVFAMRGFARPAMRWAFSA